MVGFKSFTGIFPQVYCYFTVLSKFAVTSIFMVIFYGAYLS